MEILSPAAFDASSYVVKVDFKDETGVAVQPTSAAWTLTDGLGALVNATRLSDYALLSVIQLNDRERTYIDDADALPAAMVRFSNAAAAALGTTVRDGWGDAIIG